MVHVRGRKDTGQRKEEEELELEFKEEEVKEEEDDDDDLDKEMSRHMLSCSSRNLESGTEGRSRVLRFRQYDKAPL